MPPKKVSRKKLLKEPDEFISTTGKVIQYVKARQRQMTVAGVVVLLIIAAGAGIAAYLRWQEGKALAAQYEGLSIYQEAYRASMENPAADKKDEYQKALEKFKESLAFYGWGKTAQVTRVFIGSCHAALKEYEKAQAAYHQSLDGPFRSVALNGLAHLFEAQGDFAKALDYYRKNMEETTNPYRLESLLGAARCYESLKEVPKALEVYEKALPQASKTAYADFIRWKIGELKG
ncbi:MAG: tetratricopeptide repeat protein [Syntrophaceae bacterium]|jgi:tetratricopeptide (TPR) repeat protein|nr:tetratricopeptide repeat protein [Syntrophaceae bacterium]